MPNLPPSSADRFKRFLLPHLIAIFVGWMIGLFAYGVSLRGENQFSWTAFAFSTFGVGSVLGILLPLLYWLNRFGFYMLLRIAHADNDERSKHSQAAASTKRSTKQE